MTMSSHRKIKTCFNLFLLAICTLSAGQSVLAQNGGGTTLRPIDTGKSVTFNLSANGDKVYDRIAIKTNLLYAATLTPNLGIEVGLGRRFTLEATLGYNGWGNFWEFSEPAEDAARRQLNHILAKVEGRFWFGERFEGHFAGLHAYYNDYVVNGLKVPLLFDKEYRYDGFGFGVGVSYGYNWMWNPRWGMEFNVGVGAMYMEYDKYPCAAGCDDRQLADLIRYKKTYFGPTSAGIKIYFMIR
jgi:hypothetical protein